MGEGAGEAELEAGEVFMSSRRQPMAPRYPSCWQKRAFIAPLDLKREKGAKCKMRTGIGWFKLWNQQHITFG